MKTRTQKQNPADRPLRRARKMRPSILATRGGDAQHQPSRGQRPRRAADRTGTTNALWDTTTNWSTGAKPIATSQVSFPAVVPGTGSTITLSAGELADTLSFANGYTLNGGSLTMTTGTISVTGTGIGASAAINSVLGGVNISVNTTATNINGAALTLTGVNTWLTGTTSSGQPAF